MTLTLFADRDSQPHPSAVRLISMHRSRLFGAVIGLMLIAGTTACTSDGGTATTATTPSARISIVAPVVHPSPARSRHVERPHHGRLLDVSWTSRSTGWVLESVLCKTGECARLLHTTDAGRHWHRVPLPLRHLGSLGERIAFTRNTHGSSSGYVYGPKTWSTTDSGRQWIRTPGIRAGGRHTAALAVDGDAAYRVAYRHDGCPGPCNPVIQWQVIGAISWRTVDRQPSGPDAAAQIAAAGAQVVAAFEGNLAGGADEHAEYAISADGGALWRERRDPCGGKDQTEFDTVGIAAAAPDQITTLCQSHLHHPSFLAVSTDGGVLFARQPHDGLSYPAGPDVFGSAGVMIASTTGIGSHKQSYVVARSADFGRAWRVTLRDRVPIAADQSGSLALSVAPDGAAAFIDGPFRLWVSAGPGRGWHRVQTPHP
jgi:photosystem II stability/assembly factor-like uncharacterized protein